MKFASREDAGQRLGYYLKQEGIHAEMVLGLPRGGVIVAAQVALVLGLPLEALVVRKIGHPWYREFALGALAENGVLLLDESAVAKNPLLRPDLETVIAEEQQRLQEYQAKFHRNGPPDLTDKTALLVDDGLATGATTEAAVLSLKKLGPRRIIVAAPVASTNAVERLLRVADEVRALLIDPDFDAVGRYYEVFSQTTDEEVMEVLGKEHGA